MARMRKYGESKTTRIIMATVPHVTSGLGLRKFQADGFLLTWVYIKFRAGKRSKYGGVNYSVLFKRNANETYLFILFFVNKVNLVHNLFLVYLFLIHLSISTCFGRLCAHHQEKQLCLCGTWYWLFCEIDKYTKNKSFTYLALFSRLYGAARSQNTKHIRGLEL